MLTFPSTTELFAGLDDASQRTVAGLATIVALRPGDVLFNEEDPADAVYVLLNGRLQLTRATLDGDEWVRDVTPGQVVGEIGVLANSKRTATSRATRETRVARFGSADLERLALEVPAVGLTLARRAARVAVAMVRREHPAQPIILFVGSGVHREMAELVADVAPNPMVLIRERDLPVDNGDSGVADHIDRAARDGQVLVVGKPGSVALVDLVDEVVCVVESGRLPTRRLLGALRERRTAGLVVKVVVVNNNGDSPSVGNLLDAVDPTEHVNVRDGSRADGRRLSRVLSGQKHALVLGAGGARAFAQVGALRALEEHGAEFDLIVGSGFGAVVGAQYASGWSPSELLERNRTAWRLAGRVPTVPSVSLFGGSGPARILRGWFGEAGVEDTWTQFRCCSANLSTARLVTPARGRLADWVRAASAYPGLYPPHVVHGRVHVDGSVLEPLPASVAVRLGATRITAVDTTPMRTQLVDESYSNAPEGLSWFTQILPVVGSGFPSVFALLERSMGAALRDRQAAARSLCDIVIEPPVDRYRATDLHAVDALAELGYLEASRQLERRDDN